MVQSGKMTKANLTEDRISELPDSVIDCILDRVPIGEAVRTSVLARKWRYHWTRVGVLSFDRALIDEIGVRSKIRKKERHGHVSNGIEADFVDAVGSVLLLHNGPIQKFVLHLPPYVPIMNEHLQKWLLVVSRRGVKKISIDSISTVRIPLPSSIFDCVELRSLTLRHCKVGLHYKFQGFANLIRLRFLSVTISEHELHSIVSGCPLLKNLTIHGYHGQLSLTAPRLKTLIVTESDVTKLSLDKVPNLVAFGLVVRLYHSLEVRHYDAVSVFGSVTSIASITLCNHVLQVLSKHHVPEMLPKPLECLTNLTLYNIDMAQVNIMAMVICILRSSPFLRTLSVSLTIFKRSDNDSMEPAAVTFLEKELGKPKKYLSSLLKVKIKELMGTSSQIMFLKYILTSSSALEMLYLKSRGCIVQAEELKMMSELTVCHRASTKVQISYLKPQHERAGSVSYSNGVLDSGVFDF